MRPAPDERVQLARSETPGSGALIALNDGSNFPQERLDTLRRRLDEQLTVVFADVLAQEVKAIRDVRDHGLLGREFQTALPQEHFNERFHLIFQQFLRRPSDERSSAKRIRLTLGQTCLLPVPDLAGKGRSVDELRGRPEPYSTRTGEQIPPCGVPASVGWRTVPFQVSGLQPLGGWLYPWGCGSSIHSWLNWSKAGANVALENPLGECFLASDREALFDRIGGRTLGAKPVGVRVAGRFGDGIQREQVEGLHRAVDMVGIRGRAASVLLRDVHAPQRLARDSRVAGAARWPSAFCWVVPGDAVHPGRAFALVLRHSSHGKGFAAERVGQQVLQGFDLAPPAGLCCLHDTRLEPTHVLADSPPVDGVPVHRVAGGCTSACSSVAGVAVAVICFAS